MNVAIIGGGAAGTAAAWAARRAGAEVVIFHGRPGATALYSGALDAKPWAREERRPDEPLDSGVLAFATAMEAWSVGARSARVVTHEGVLRPARGLDSALLDVAALAGRTIAVADVRVDGWDARSLARSLTRAPWAAANSTRFEAVHVSGFAGEREAKAPWFDLATLHDDSSRVHRLARALDAASESVEAWLFGPWLGTIPGVAERLSSLVNKPCGETTSPPGSAAGARFETSRDALLASVGVRVEHGAVEQIARRDRRFFPSSRPTANGAGAGERQGAAAREIGFDALVLAAGGLVAGGLVLEGGGDHAARFTCPLVAEAFIGLDGKLVDHTSSIHGVDLAELGMHALGRVGVLAEANAAAGAPDIFVAGDCVADRPRTVLEAVRSGIAAARAAVAFAR